MSNNNYLLSFNKYSTKIRTCVYLKHVLIKIIDLVKASTKWELSWTNNLTQTFQPFWLTHDNILTILENTHKSFTIKVIYNSAFLTVNLVGFCKHFRRFNVHIIIFLGGGGMGNVFYVKSSGTVIKCSSSNLRICETYHTEGFYYQKNIPTIYRCQTCLKNMIQHK